MKGNITESLILYFKNYFNFTGRTNRRNYWWAMSMIYIISIILSNIAIATEVLYLPVIWLVINIVPLLSLNTRRLRDIGLTNYSLLIIISLIIITATLVVLTKSTLAALVLQVTVILVVIAPILKTDELTAKTNNFFVREN